MITVQFFKYPDRPHWRHETHRLGQDEHGVWLGAASGAIVQRGEETPIELTGPTVQLIPSAAYWSLIYNPGGHKYPFYIDIGTPATWVDDHRVEIIDLDLDVVRKQDGSVEVLDEEEFRDNQVRLGYPDWLVDRARTAAAELVLQVEAEVEPFGRLPEHWLQKL
jgi:protein associated with RNAse G/E